MAGRELTLGDQALDGRGSCSNRTVLVTADRLLPTRVATSSWVSPKSSMSCWNAAASSSAVRSCALKVLDQRLLDQPAIVGRAG